ncbi:glutaredoxin-1 isoform X2 [Eptesicus fuscus]|uniref:glutaredoxin-1 isoform X2 n=1 Tax=Eptesicus fuscus TaxID=29078 RepID=UPI002404050A|nr:glutaredoxin-1 isoform X2 [Eptesicus fuscus]
MQPTCTAQEFVDSHLKPGRMVVFMKPTCSFCKRTEELLCQYPFKKESLVFVDITVTRNTEKVQDYLQHLTGARTSRPRLMSPSRAGWHCERWQHFWWMDLGRTLPSN